MRSMGHQREEEGMVQVSTWWVCANRWFGRDVNIVIASVEGSHLSC